MGTHPVKDFAAILRQDDLMPVDAAFGEVVAEELRKGLDGKRLTRISSSCRLAAIRTLICPIGLRNPYILWTVSDPSCILLIFDPLV